MKDKVSSVKVELPHNNLTKEGHILHEQEYNTGHGVSVIFDEICRETRCQPCQPKVQQKLVVYLLLESPVERKRRISGLSVPASSQPSQSAHRGRAKTDPGYAPP